jgi:hypothetical protein
MHLELVTVTDTSPIITWFTGDPTGAGRVRTTRRRSAAPGRVLIGTAPNPTDVGAGRRARADAVPLRRGVRPAPGHDVLLARGERRHPRVMTTISNPLPAPADAPLAAPPTFTTMVPPPGRELGPGRLAERPALRRGHLGPGDQQRRPPRRRPAARLLADPDDPYWRFMSQAAVARPRPRLHAAAGQRLT